MHGSHLSCHSNTLKGTNAPNVVEVICTCIEVCCYGIDLGASIVPQAKPIRAQYLDGSGPIRAQYLDGSGPIRVQYLDGSGPIRVLHSVLSGVAPAVRRGREGLEVSPGRPDRGRCSTGGI